MYAPANLSRYGTVSVTTASPGRLLVLLYDALFRFTREAIAAIEQGNKVRATERISRAHAILAQLLSGLDRTVSPKLCDQLEPLYAFCMHTAVEAMIQHDGAKLTSILTVLAPLREAWMIAVAQTEAAASQPATPTLRKAG